MSEASSVTIGLPVHDDLTNFQKAVQSIFAQTFTDWRLLVVIDGSNSQIADAASHIEDPRVTVVSDGMHVGLAQRLNQITGLARTRLVARMDADDIMHPDRLRQQIEHFRLRPGLDLLATRAYMIDERDVIVGLYKEPRAPRTERDYLTNGVFTHPTIMFTREWGIQHPYSTQWVRTEDKEVWLRAAAVSRYERLDRALLYYRVSKPLSAQKQKLTAQFDRRLVRERASAVGMGRSEKYTYLATSRAKQHVFQVLTRTGFSSVVQRSKAESLKSAANAEAASALRSVQSVSVPGWRDFPGKPA